MTKKMIPDLSRRERQIMDIIYQKGEASAAEIRKSMTDPPSYSSVRTFLRILEDKGLLTHIEQNLKYVYIPVIPQDKASESALQHLIKTFFNGSPEKVVAAIIGGTDTKMSKKKLEEIAKLIDQAKKEGK
ncbi:BlaI/MecI/CopY family transcriptional regulator [candidate division KSB1 bacterium]